MRERQSVKSVSLTWVGIKRVIRRHISGKALNGGTGLNIHKSKRIDGTYQFSSMSPRWHHGGAKMLISWRLDRANGYLPGTRQVNQCLFSLRLFERLLLSVSHPAAITVQAGETYMVTRGDIRRFDSKRIPLRRWEFSSVIPQTWRSLLMFPLNVH